MLYRRVNGIQWLSAKRWQWMTQVATSQKAGVQNAFLSVRDFPTFFLLCTKKASAKLRSRATYNICNRP